MKSQESHVVALQWFKSGVGSEAPSLAVLLANGQLQLMRSERDDAAVLVDTQLEPVDCRWNHDGRLLAVAGRSTPANANVIHFYSAAGQLVRVMKLPGQHISGLAWEGYSLRLAFAIDSYIYLAQVKHDYMWTCFSNTLVYHFNKKDKAESYVMFWDTKNNEVRNHSPRCTEQLNRFRETFRFFFFFSVT